MVQHPNNFGFQQSLLLNKKNSPGTFWMPLTCI